MSTKCASVSFNGRQLIPAPLVNIQRQITRAADGTPIGTIFPITLNGTLHAYKGSPASTGTVNDPNWDNAFWVASDYPPDETPQVKFDQLINKLEHLKNLFNDDGGLLEIQSSDGSAPLRANVRLGDLAYEQGKWTDIIPYSIQLEADFLLGGFTSSGSLGSGEFNFPQFLADISESWDLQFNDQPESHERLRQHTFRLVHSLSARGKTAYDTDSSLIKPAWQWAKDWVTERVGFDSNQIISTGLFNLTGTYNGWNHARSEIVDEAGGSYSVTESWIVSSGSALENFTVTSDSSATDPIQRVTIQGDIQGLELVNYGTTVSGVITSGFGVGTTKWESASGLFNSISGQLYERAYSYARASDFTRTLNPTPQSFQINRNPVVGTISYTFTYDTRRSLCVDGALSESIVITDRGPADAFAQIPIIGRANGVLLQDLNTLTERTRNVSIEVITYPPTGCPTSASKVNSLLAQSPYWAVDTLIDSLHAHLLASYDTVFVQDDTDSWDISNGRYSRNITWNYGVC